MSNPFGMAEVSVPQLIGLNESMKSNRLEQLYRQRAMEMQQKQFEMEEKKAAREDKMYGAYADAFGGGAASSPGTTPVADGGAPAPQAAPWKPDPAKLRALMATGPQGVDAAKAIMSLSADQLKTAQEGMVRLMEIKGRVVNGVRALPPEQREMGYQKERAQLIANGADPTTLPEHWDENVANQMITTSMEAAKALGLEQEAKQFAETVRSHHATEGIAAGNLDLSRKREARVTKWGPQPLIGVLGNVPSSTDDLNY